jgi:hypothetical protein
VTKWFGFDAALAGVLRSIVEPLIEGIQNPLQHACFTLEYGTFAHATPLLALRDASIA